MELDQMLFSGLEHKAQNLAPTESFYLTLLKVLKLRMMGNFQVTQAVIFCRLSICLEVINFSKVIFCLSMMFEDFLTISGTTQVTILYTISPTILWITWETVSGTIQEDNFRETLQDNFRNNFSDNFETNFVYNFRNNLFDNVGEMEYLPNLLLHQFFVY